MIYCDNNATTALHAPVRDAMNEALSLYANASGVYKSARLVREAIESARTSVASAIGCRADQLLFNGSGTEANNQVLKQYIERKCRVEEKIHVLVSAIEHSSVIKSATYLRQFGIEVDIIEVHNNGTVNIDAYKRLFKPYTKFVSILLANNETGVIQDIPTLSKIAHEHNALFHSDAVQALGKIPVNVHDLGVDFLTVSSHKIYGPKGAAALYVADDDTVLPFMHGGQHERNLRAGTENAVAIIGFQKAVELLDTSFFNQHTKILKETFKTGLLASLSDLVFHDHNEGLSNTVSVSFLGISGHKLAMNCDLEGIYVSTGSACAAGSPEPSHVINAYNIDEETNKSTLRFSFGLYNTAEEIKTVVEKVSIMVKRMRRI
jgi:cysteine desulfurase